MDPLAFVWNTIVYNPMLNGMLFLYSFIPNYGVAIIVFTILIALATMPFRIKSQASMRKQQEKMAAIKPKLDEIKKKYKDNPQELQRQQMKLYQEQGVANPFNMGCLLTLLPFPIFIGMYNVIVAVMGDKPESMMQMAPHIYPFFPSASALIPVNSNFLGLNIGALTNTQNIVVIVVIVGLVVGTSFLQTKMMTPATASLDPSQAQMNQSMMLMTPLIFGFFVLNAPIGLSLYWITFSVMGILQQGFTGGWDSLTNLLPKKAPQVVRTKRVAESTGSSTKSVPQVTATNGNENTTPASTNGDAAAVTKGKKKSGKKR
ncbi:MAG: membrane protein insertase YidC [Anaerolineae bacterium]|nr:membrane protein insertase YidC [Anaerolineae bacterium]